MMIYEHLIKVCKGPTLLIMGWEFSYVHELFKIDHYISNVVSQLMQLSVSCVKNMFAFSNSQSYKLSYMILNIVMC
jgi:hypothetical protein